MKTTSFFRHIALTLFLILAATSCTEDAVGDDEIATVFQSAAAAPSSVQGYLHPFHCEMWLEFEGQRRSWWACPGSPELEVSMDLSGGTVFFRSPRAMQLVQLWDAQGYCPVSYASAALSREYNYWVLAVELTDDFSACLHETEAGFYFRLELGP